MSEPLRLTDTDVERLCFRHPEVGELVRISFALGCKRQRERDAEIARAHVPGSVKYVSTSRIWTADAAERIAAAIEAQEVDHEPT